MPMFYFNIAAGTEIIADLEGTDLESLDAARQSAIEDARELMSAAILNGWDISKRCMRISDEAGNLLLAVPFADAIRPTD